MRQMLVAILFLLAFVVEVDARAVYRIADDHGGRIGKYIDKYRGLRSSGELVVLDGLCASACTIALGAIPRDKLCATEKAELGFHAAWNFGRGGRAVKNTEATNTLFSMYPSGIRHWIVDHGGLTPHMIFLQGQELQGYVRPCTPAEAFGA